VLQGPEELHAAVERAREYERRGIHEYQRRLGDYDRFLVDAAVPANVVSIETSRGDSPAEPDSQTGTEGT
jgi:hypothetical protein